MARQKSQNPNPHRSWLARDRGCEGPGRPIPTRHGARGKDWIAGRGNFELRGALGDLGELAMRLPLPSAARGRVLVVGGLYIDVVSEVAEFPREDSACRALATWRSRGGNASNTAVVLAELLGEAGRVAWMGAVPSEDDPDTAFVLEAMRVVGVDTRSLEPVGGDAGQPRAIIVLSRATGTRTIISSRQGLRELSPTHFARALDAAYASNAAPCWVHFECRELPSVLHCAEAVARARGEAASPLVSLEVEKPHMSPHALAPLLPLCDVVFLSKEWTLAQAGALQARACAWGGRM